MGRQRAAMSHRPQRVFKIATHQAESIMDGSQAKYYDAAADWLKYARAAYESAGRLAEWRTYLDGLLVTHGRKYKLVPLLKELA